MALPALYAARADVRPDDLPRVERWYEGRHGPDLLRAGFHSAQVYSSEGTPLVCNLCESGGREVFQTPAYRAVVAGDAEWPAVIALVTNRSNAICAQALTVGRRRTGRGRWTRRGSARCGWTCRRARRPGCSTGTPRRSSPESDAAPPGGPVPTTAGEPGGRA